MGQREVKKTADQNTFLIEPHGWVAVPDRQQNPQRFVLCTGLVAVGQKARLRRGAVQRLYQRCALGTYRFKITAATADTGHFLQLEERKQGPKT